MTADREEKKKKKISYVISHAWLTSLTPRWISQLCLVADVNPAKHEMPTFDDHTDDASLYCSVRRVRRGFVCTVAALVLDSLVTFGAVF